MFQDKFLLVVDILFQEFAARGELMGASLTSRAGFVPCGGLGSGGWWLGLWRVVATGFGGRCLSEGLLGWIFLGRGFLMWLG